MSKDGSHLSWTNQPSFLEILPERLLVTVTSRQQVDFLSCAILVTRNGVSIVSTKLVFQRLQMSFYISFQICVQSVIFDCFEQTRKRYKIFRRYSDCFAMNP
nr:unnamed protein product [Callosobruchus analis]